MAGAMGRIRRVLGKAVLLLVPALLTVAPEQAAARSGGDLTSEISQANRALSTALHAVRANRETHTVRAIRQVGRHLTRAEEETHARVWRTPGGRRARTTKGRRLIWLRALGAQQARSAERLARNSATGREPMRRSMATQVARDTAGLRRTIRRQERAIRSLRGRARQMAEGQLASFLRDRVRVADRLQRTLQAGATEAAGRRVLRALGQSERAARQVLRRLGKADPSQEPSAGQQQAGPEESSGAVTPPQPITATPEPGTLLSDRFERALAPNDLITNHFAVLHHTDGSAIRSPNWELTSGTLFHQAGTGWTGTPTFCTPDRFSQTCTGSVIFRMRSHQASFGDVAVSARFRHNGFVESAERPAVQADGINVWPRYDSQYRLYVASVVRRDGIVKIRKKCPGGPSNGGTYHTLSWLREASLSPGDWHDVTVSARTVQAGTAVELRLVVDGTERLAATDTGVGCAPILEPGRIGFRGDNSDFNLDDVIVIPLS